MALYVTGGGLRVDYIITHDGRVLLNMPGGNSIYSAVGARLWRNEVAIWTRMGENYPVVWLDELESLGLKLDALIPTRGTHDHRTFYSYTPDGRRIDTDPAYHFARIGQPLPKELLGYIHSTPGQDNPDLYEPLALQPEDWPNHIQNVAGVHLAPLPLRSHLAVTSALKQRGIRLITLDPGERYMVPELSEYIRRILPSIDIFMPSLQELQSLFGTEHSLAEALNTLSDWGARMTVVKMGASGSLIHNGITREETMIPAYHPPGSKKIVDVTGAGDAYCGGFLAGLVQTNDPYMAGLMGAVSASIVIEGYGALYALQAPSAEANQRLQKLLKTVR